MTIIIDGTNGISGVDGTAANPAVEGTDANTGLFYPAADTVGVSTGGSERMRVDSSGNVGIGTSSPSSILDVFGNTGDMLRLGRNNTGAVGNQIAFRHSNAGTMTETASINAISTANADSASLNFYTKPSGGSNTLRASIDSSGNLLVGKTTQNGSGIGVEILPNVSSLNFGRINMCSTYAAAANCINFSYNGTIVGYIQQGTSSVVYSTTSDYRLKENITPMTTGLEKINALKPVTYDWISDKSAGEGFIAHELQEAIPAAVTGEKDAVDEEGRIVPQGVDYSKLVVHLVAAVQELSAEVKALKAKVGA
jgi:hypothetical protein